MDKPTAVYFEHIESGTLRFIAVQPNIAFINLRKLIGILHVAKQPNVEDWRNPKAPMSVAILNWKKHALIAYKALTM